MQSGFGEHAEMVRPQRDEGADPRYANDLNGLATQGIPVAATDEDIWSRVCDKETQFISTKEDLFFETLTELPFERRHRLRHGRPGSELPMPTDE